MRLELFEKMCKRYADTDRAIKLSEVFIILSIDRFETLGVLAKEIGYNVEMVRDREADAFITIEKMKGFLRLEPVDVDSLTVVPKSETRMSGSYYHPLIEDMRISKDDLISKLSKHIRLKKKTKEALKKLTPYHLECLVEKVCKKIESIQARPPIVDDLTEKEALMIANVCWRIWKGCYTGEKIDVNQMYTVTVKGSALFTVNRVARKLYRRVRPDDDDAGKSKSDG